APPSRRDGPGEGVASANGGGREAAGPAGNQQHALTRPDAASQQEAGVPPHARQVQLQVAVLEQRRHRDEGARQPGAGLVPVHRRDPPLAPGRSAHSTRLANRRAAPSPPAPLPRFRGEEGKRGPGQAPSPTRGSSTVSSQYLPRARIVSTRSSNLFGFVMNDAALIS